MMRSYQRVINLFMSSDAYSVIAILLQNELSVN